MVEAARRTNRVVQVGLQQRSGTHFQRAVKDDPGRAARKDLLRPVLES